MVRGIEDLRTPLRTIIDLDVELRGTLSGFMMPAFVIDLPGGGGKRLVSTYDTYDEISGVATYRAPGLPGTKGQMEYTYYDPKPDKHTITGELRPEQAREADSLSQDQARPTVPQQQHSMPRLDRRRYRQPPVGQNAGLVRMSAASNTPQKTINPVDPILHHHSASRCQLSPSAAAP